MHGKQGGNRLTANGAPEKPGSGQTTAPQKTTNPPQPQLHKISIFHQNPTQKRKEPPNNNKNSESNQEKNQSNPKTPNPRPPKPPKKQIAAPGSACYTAGMEFDFNRFLGFTGNFGVVLLASGLLDDLLSVAGGTPIGRILMASGAALIYLSSFRQKDNE